MRDWNVASLDRLGRVAQHRATGSWLAFSGHPLLKRNIAGSNDTPGDLAVQLLDQLEERGIAALGEVDGAFAIAWWSASRRELHLIRDRFGAEPLYYALVAGQLLFASRIRDLTIAGSIRPTVCADGLAEFLVYCYLPGNRTLHDGVLRVPAGSSLVYSPARGATVQRWYALSFAEPFEDDESSIAVAYRGALERAVEGRLGPTDPGAFLSGGMDSSSAVTFARRHWRGDIQSFGFRCAGTSFDESVYARRLAEALAVRHTEVDYGERESISILQAIPEMEVPFCDVGIEVGTWLLGAAAQGRVDYVLTGDGGDEIWASHPVYAAQKLFRWYDRLPLPSAIGDFASRMASHLPDSDHKRDLAVILKRILPPPGIPKGLRHFRWRVYWSIGQLADLLTPEWARKLGSVDPFDCVRRSFDGYRGPDDGISPLLYSDYVTASGFYFSRLMLLRHFGIVARTPFYDRELVEFGARIPARLKLEGIERTKRLFRFAMKGVLPDIVNERTDKLGHSVPLKNWLRTNSALNSLMTSMIASKAIEARGMLRVDAVMRLLEEHRARRHNHSHRLWAILVLEHWLQSHLD
jgi:asparagine synthase (glutamine-hydrolysing)